MGTATKFGINVNDDLTVLGASEIKLNEGGANVRVQSDGIVDTYTLVSGAGDDLIDFREGDWYSPSIQNSAGEDDVTLSYQGHDEHEGVSLSLYDIADSPVYTLVENVDGDASAGDRVKGAMVDTIVLSNGADTVNIDGSADQHLRPGYVHENGLGDHTHVSLKNVEIIRLDDQTEYHLLQDGSGTLNDFYYYDTRETADISGLGDGMGEAFEVSADGKEALEDIAAIGQISVDFDSDDDGERDYTELVEYIRIAVQLVFSDLHPELETEAEPTIH